MRAKVVAVKLDLPEDQAWIDLELGGYQTTDVPKYRVIKGEPKAMDPVVGRWVPMVFRDERSHDMISTRPVVSAISEIEDILPGAGELIFPFAPGAVKLLTEIFKIPSTRMGQFVHRSALSGILHAVRKRVLDWALALESAGTQGKGLSVSGSASRTGPDAVFTAQVVKVMIASPSDVLDERQVIRDEIYKWNAIHAEDRGIVLLPVGWETHSAPETGDRPQAILNKQILKNCDLLVAVFWTRLGSPTGVAESGTIEEIDEHVAAGKPAMIYFSDALAPPSTVDAAQLVRVRKFRESLRDRCLYEQYQDLSSFRDKFSRNLAQQVINRFAHPAAAPTEQPAPIQQSPRISNEASHLLAAAVTSEGGGIMRVRTFGGTFIQANEETFGEPDNARSSALWSGAVDELERLGWIEDRAGKREVYFVTGEGYKAADQLVRDPR